MGGCLTRNQIKRKLPEAVASQRQLSEEADARVQETTRAIRTLEQTIRSTVKRMRSQSTSTRRMQDAIYDNTLMLAKKKRELVTLETVAGRERRNLLTFIATSQNLAVDPRRKAVHEMWGLLSEAKDDVIKEGGARARIARDVGEAVADGQEVTDQEERMSGQDDGGDSATMMQELLSGFLMDPITDDVEKLPVAVHVVGYGESTRVKEVELVPAEEERRVEPISFKVGKGMRATARADSEEEDESDDESHARTRRADRKREAKRTEDSTAPKPPAESQG